MERKAPKIDDRLLMNKPASFDMGGLSMGQYGFDLIKSDTELATNEGYGYCCIEVLDDTVFAAETEILQSSSMVNEGVKAGLYVFGLIKSIKLTSGRVMAYKFPTEGLQ